MSRHAQENEMDTEAHPEAAQSAPPHVHEGKRVQEEKRSSTQRASDRGSRATKTKPTTQRSGSKQGQVIALLSRKTGVTIAAIMRATGWQKHSVHGFLAGVVKKKLGLGLVSEKTNGDRIYRIQSRKGDKRAATKSSSRKRAG